MLESKLRDVVGLAHVLTDPADVLPFVTDWRGHFRGNARAVVRPRTTTEVAEIVSICATEGIPIVPQGGNTGLCGGATPDAQGTAIVLSLCRLNRVRAIDRDNATLTAEAGVTLAAAQQAARERGMSFPLSLAAEGSCTIGGNISTNAGGTAVLRYGNMRDLVLGVEAVLPDGRTWNGLRGLRKDNTGYDLKQLFIGSEGTLGIVTCAVLKLFPAPLTQATAFVAVADPAAAVRLLTFLRSALGDRLVAFELMSKATVALSHFHQPGTAPPMPGHPWYVLVQVDTSWVQASLLAEVEEALAGALDSGLAADAVVGQSGAEARRLWSLRENIGEAQRLDGPHIKHDISLPTSSVPEFLVEAESCLRREFPDVRLWIFGHLGDGNLHYNVAPAPGADREAFIAKSVEVQRVVHDLIGARGGSISAEHGIGQSKREDLLRYKNAIDLDLMRTLKHTLDPQAIMNPGKVV